MGGLVALFILYQPLFASQIIVKNDLLNSMVADKITQIGLELKDKTGILLVLGAYENLNSKSISEVFDGLNLKAPFVFLILAKDEHRVEIFADDDTLRLFKKEQVLSPFPENGTILPILTSNKGKDIYNAALLNGYADIAEQIATSKGVTLKTSIGNANKTTINFMRFLIYGSIVLVFLVMIYRKRKA